MSEDTVKHRIHKYRIGDKFNFDTVVEILDLVKQGYENSDSLEYFVAMPDGKRTIVTEDWIDAGIKSFGQKSAQYAVPHTASAPKEFKVGDRVRIKPFTQSRNEGEVGTITLILPNGLYRVGFGGYCDDYPYQCFEEVPNIIHFDEQNKYEPIPLIDASSELVNRFKKITDEMVETYKAKNATYGNAYADGFSRFGAVQLVSRIYEKYCRIENLLVRKADNKVSDESVRDTLTDIANQCIILRMLLESQDVK